MFDTLTMQNKSKYIAYFLLACILVSVIACIYVVYGIVANHNNIQAAFPGYNWQDDYTGVHFGYVIVILIQRIAIILAMALAYSIFRTIGRGASPFSPDISKHIREIGILLIIASVIAWPVGSMTAKAIWPDKVSYPILFSIDWGNLILGFIISCLASIFQYGCNLQKESDETL
jgi:hypothetical protein